MGLRKEIAPVSSIRSLVSVSALLAVTSFVGVMVFAPVDGRNRDIEGYGAQFGLSDQATRMRLALTNGRDLAAQNIAARTVDFFADQPEAWLWKVQVEWSTGRLETAAEDARRLESMILAGPVPAEPLMQSARAYRLGWANWVLSRQEAAQSNFLDAATLYEVASPGFVSESIRQYNLACYLAMAGDPDRAGDHFAQAVDAGYSGDAGWWRVDPDLNSIRKHPLYLDAATVLERRARDRALRREGRRRGEEDPFDGAWLPSADDPDAGPADAGSDAPALTPGSWRSTNSLEAPPEPEPDPEPEPEPEPEPKPDPKPESDLPPDSPPDTPLVPA